MAGEGGNDMDNTPAPPPPPEQPGRPQPQPSAHPPQQVAVWYFIAATFIFTLPGLMFPDAPAWVRILLFVTGLLVIAAGGIQFAKEIRERRNPSPPPTPPAA
ncbi:hypothetical protein [Microbacterium aurantiacum]|uniref:hypothetical protein n=1 Tax=Microbacterium aurantiacum TaxID=162393 RepID=UPI0012E7A25B|nr:hypothetical protein [Microbacterium chocolatum]